MNESLTVRIKLRKKDGRVKFKRFRSGGWEHYNPSIWIDGPDDELDKVDRVEYELHESFAKPIRISSRRDRKFRISLWTWGVFDVALTIYYKDGRLETRDCFLTYKLPPDGEANYIDVGDF